MYNKFGILCDVMREEESDAKPLVVLHGEIKTPPFSKAARIEAVNVFANVAEGYVLVDADFASDAGHRKTMCRIADCG